MKNKANISQKHQSIPYSLMDRYTYCSNDELEDCPTLIFDSDSDDKGDYETSNIDDSNEFFEEVRYNVSDLHQIPEECLGVYQPGRGPDKLPLTVLYLLAKWIFSIVHLVSNIFDCTTVDCTAYLDSERELKKKYGLFQVLKISSYIFFSASVFTPPHLPPYPKLIFFITVNYWILENVYLLDTVGQLHHLASHPLLDLEELNLSTN